MKKIEKRFIVKKVPGIDRIRYRTPTNEEADVIRAEFSKPRTYVFINVMMISVVMTILTYAVRYIAKNYDITDHRVWVPYGVLAFLVVVYYIRFLKHFAAETIVKVVITDDEGYNDRYGCTDIICIGKDNENADVINEIFKSNKKIVRYIEKISQNGKSPAIQILCAEHPAGLYYALLICSN